MTFYSQLSAAARHHAQDRALEVGLAAHVDVPGLNLRTGLKGHRDQIGASLNAFHTTTLALRARQALYVLRARRTNPVVRLAAGTALASFAVVAVTAMTSSIMARAPLPGFAEAAMRNYQCGLTTSLVTDSEGVFMRAVPVQSRPDCPGVADGVRSLPVRKEMANAIEKAVVATEGAHEGWGTLWGHDVRGIIRYALSRAGLPFAGGSSSYLTAVESVAGEAETTGLLRKIANMQASSLLHARQSPEERRHLLAEAPLLGYANGVAVSGGAFLEIFGTDLTSEYHPCLVAAAYREPLRAGDKLTDRQADQAKRCVKLTISEAERQEAAIAAFDSYRAPNVGSLLNSTVRLIEEAAAQRAAPLPANARLAFSLRTQAAFDTAVTQALTPVLAKVNPRLREQNGKPRVYASFILARANPDGSLRLVAAHTSHANLMFGYPPVGYGSQHKIIAALLAARSPTNLICNLKVGAMRNTSGPAPVASCDSPGAMITVGEAIGRSMNTPFAALAETADEYRQIEAALGFTGNETAPMRARPLGAGGPRASAARFIEIHAALHHARHGRPAMSAGLSLMEPAARGGVDLAQAGIEAVAAARAASYFEAPVKLPFGTLRAWRGENFPNRWAAAAGKSGTGETDFDDVRGRSQTVTFTNVNEAHGLILFGWIESADANVALGPISHADLKKVMSAGLRAAVTTSTDLVPPDGKEAINRGQDR